MRIYVGAANANSKTLCMNEMKVMLNKKNTKVGTLALMISLASLLVQRTYEEGKPTYHR